MALKLDRQIKLILVGPRIGNTTEFEAPTLTPVWGRLLQYNVESDVSDAGGRPAGLAKVAIRYRQEFSARTSFPGTWTPTTAPELREWNDYRTDVGDIQDSFVADGVIFVILETEHYLLRDSRRRYVTLYGEAGGTIGYGG